MRLRPFIGIIVCVVLSACGGQEEHDPSGPAAIAAGESESESRPAPRLDACEYLTASAVSAEFGIAESDLREGLNDEKYCAYKWDRQGSPGLERSVHLTLAPPFPDEKSATVAFSAMKERLQEGVTVKIDDETKKRATEAGGDASAIPDSATFQADVGEPLEEIGDAAFWSSSLSQLSVRKGSTIFHVGVKATDEESENFESAKRLALIAAGRM